MQFASNFKRVSCVAAALSATVALSNPVAASEPDAFAGSPKTPAECAAYVAEGNRLMGLAAHSLIALANADAQSAGAIVPASPAPSVSGVEPLGETKARPHDRAEGAAGGVTKTRAANDLVDRGSKLFHLGLACEGAAPAK